MMGAGLLQFQAQILDITHESPLFRPPAFPPPRDFTVSLTRNGKPLSAYGDDCWDFSGWNIPSLNFRRYNLSRGNLDLVKQSTFFVIYHPRLFPGRLSSCRGYFQTLMKIAYVCDEHGILISDLHKFPRMFPLIADALLGSNGDARITMLHKFNVWSDELGFCIGSSRLLEFLRKRSKKHQHVQTPYIPPRIWTYQIQRLTEVLDDVDQHERSVENAFEWLMQAYRHNLKSAPNIRYASPFIHSHLHRSRRVVYDGKFDDFLQRHGLLDLFRRWIGANKASREEGDYRVHTFAKYLTFVRDVSVLYILNFSLQRNTEGCSLRTDCFHVEKDQNLGNVYYLAGETTKTHNDSSARWVVPATVKKAVDAATKVAHLRLSALPEDLPLSKKDRDTPYLLFPSTEPWSASPSKIRTTADVHGQVLTQRKLDYSQIFRRDLKLFDGDEICINEEDAKLALSLTPNLDKREWFKVGEPWKFTAHQLRRTLAVNMFASDLVSASSLQHQMKHLSRTMTLYYGRHHTNLRLNSEAEKTLILESYDSTYRNLVDVVENDEEYVKPHGKIYDFNSIPELVTGGEEKKLMKLIKAGVVGIRRTALGFCMKKEHCEYGGIESISMCAGGEGGGICADAIFRRKDKDKLLRLRENHRNELERLPKDSMRGGALKQEIHAIGVYLDVIKRDRSEAGE